MRLAANYLPLFLLNVTVGILALGRKPAAENDLLILRDGGLRIGGLESCSAQACTFRGGAIPRSAIILVGLNGVQPTLPQV
jgi:hypothetical protein